MALAMLRFKGRAKSGGSRRDVARGGYLLPLPGDGGAPLFPLPLSPMGGVP